MKELRSGREDVHLAHGDGVMHILFMKEVHVQVVGNGIRNRPVLQLCRQSFTRGRFTFTVEGHWRTERGPGWCYSVVRAGRNRF